jgi:glutamine synthetase type III
MIFNTIIQFFTPKDKVFYSLFEEVAINVAEMGKLMKEVVAEPDFDKRAVIIKKVEDLERAVDEATHMHGDSLKQAKLYRDSVFAAMNALRADGDVLETLVDSDIWPLPSYGDLLYYS